MASSYEYALGRREKERKEGGDEEGEGREHEERQDGMDLALLSCMYIVYVYVRMYVCFKTRNMAHL